MPDKSKIVEIILYRQSEMRKEIDKRGLLMKVIAQDSGIKYETLLTYFPAAKDKQPVQIPGSAIFALTGHLPPEILSMLLPTGHLIVQAPEEIDHDQIAEAMREYLAEKDHAHHPESPAGRDIAPCEDNVLRGKFARVAA